MDERTGAVEGVDVPSNGTVGDAVAVLAIEGMHCGSCVALIEEALVEDLGVVRADVDLQSGQATVHYDPTQQRLADLCDAVAAAGYAASPIDSTGAG